MTMRKGVNITPEKLMTYAKNKYNIMTRHKVWNALSQDHETIVSISSTVQELKYGILKLAKDFLDKTRKENYIY